MSVEQYATLSNYTVAAATAVCALAWLAYLVEWAFERQVTRGVLAERRETRELVAAGGPSTPPVPDPAIDETALDHEERRDSFGRVGTALTVLSLALLVVGVLARAFAAQRVPWANMYEFSMTGVTAVLGAYLVMVRTSGVRWLGAMVTGFAVLVLGLSFLVYVPAGPTVPALESYWLVIHVVAAMTAGGLFFLGAAISILYLLRSRAEARTPDADERVGFLWRLPSSVGLDRLAYRVHALAFPVWTFGALIAGPIWAQHAWGRYWGWDPKEVWAFITWVAYAGYLHARATAGWKGRSAAILALVAFATFLFNYVGVNLFVSGLHSYAK